MGYSNAGIIFWKGDYGAGDKHIKTMRLPWSTNGKPTMVGIVAIKDAILPYTNCNYEAAEYLSKLTIGAAKPDVDANLDIKAVIAFKNSADGVVYRIEIPAPVDSMFEETGEGDRVKQADLVAIVDALSAAYILTFIPMWGKKIQRG